MFKKVTIWDIAEIKSWKRLPKWCKLINENTGYPYIRVTDFSDWWWIEVENIRYITKEIYEQISKYIITDNDLYVSIAGTIWKTGIVPSDLSWANLTENAVRLVYKNPHEIYNKYIYYFTISQSFIDQAWLATRTVAMPKLAISRLREIELLLPSYEKQIQIVKDLDEKMEQSWNLLELYKNQTKNIYELQKSFLNETFKI